jgi:hypothetical protein
LRAGSYTVPERWVARSHCTAVHPHPLRLPMCGDFNKTAETSWSLRRQHETIWAHKAPGTPGVCLGIGIRRCPMGGLVLVAPVSSDVLIWTADGSFYIHILGAWPASSSEKCSLFFSSTEPLEIHRTRCIHRLMGYFYGCVKMGTISKYGIWHGSQV